MKIIPLIVFLLATVIGPWASGDSMTQSAFQVEASYELYGWQTDNQDWSFALLPMTNRNKLLQEVQNPKTELTDLKSLKAKLAQLAAGTYICWNPLPKTVQSAPPQKLPKALVDDIRQYAKEHQLDIRILDETTGQWH